MSKWNPVKRPFERPVLTLTLVFVLWKLLLLLIALTSPGRGYDTSTQLIIARNTDGNIDGKGETRVLSEDSILVQTQKVPYQWLSQLLTKLFRWDAIYFVEIAERGYQFEQEWAFGWGYTRLLSWASKYIIIFAFQTSPALAVALAGVAISHVAHYVAIISLYHLVDRIAVHPEDDKLAFVTSMLHIMSPAGAFLSAPYAEATFAALSFLALSLYLPTRAPGLVTEGIFLEADAKIIVAGALFGLSTTLRSNGLLSGIYFLFDVIYILTNKPTRIFDIRCMRRIFCLAIGGFLILIGFCYPQYVAYAEYCNESADNGSRRAWCDTRIPSIYSYVQSTYWDVGFMRYWTLSNVPLFLLATPVMCLMIVSAIEPFLSTINPACQQIFSEQDQSRPMRAEKAAKKDEESYSLKLVFKRSIAVPQLALALATLLSFHVQIINRVSSGYPLWYIYMAEKIVRREVITIAGKRIDIGKLSLTWMVMYAIVQAGLFTSFLPPA